VSLNLTFNVAALKGETEKGERERGRGKSERESDAQSIYNIR